MSSLYRVLSALSGVDTRDIHRLLIIGVPIIGGMLSQSLINLVDAALVGRIDATSLAAVGVGSYAAFVTVSIVMGLSAAVQAVVSRYYGASRLEDLTTPLIAGLLLTSIISLPLTVGFLLLAPSYIALFTDDASVIAIAVPYFQWRCSALTFVGMGFAFRGFWSGIGESSVYLRIVLWMHLANVVISYLLMFGIGSFQGFGAVGSGMGTAAAMLIAAVIFTIRTFAWDDRAYIGWKGISWHDVKQLAALAIPNSLQQTLFALGISVLFFIIGLVGTAEQAIGHILTQLSLLLILPAVGLGIAGASLIGQSLGRGEIGEARHWGWRTVRLAIVIFAVLGLPLWLMPSLVLNLFTYDSNLIALGSLPIRITGLLIIFEVTAIILTQSLLGAGASKHVLIINIMMQWLLFLPLAFWIGPMLGYGLLGIWILQSCQRILLSIIYIGIWKTNSWTLIKVT